MTTCSICRLAPAVPLSEPPTCEACGLLDHVAQQIEHPLETGNGHANADWREMSVRESADLKMELVATNVRIDELTARVDRYRNDTYWILVGIGLTSIFWVIVALIAAWLKIP